MRAELKQLNRANLQRTYQCEDLLERIHKKKDNMFMTQTSSSQHDNKTLSHKPSYSTLEKMAPDVNTAVNQRIKGVVTATGSSPVDIDMTKLTAAQRQQVQQKLAKIEQLRSDQQLLKN